MQISTLLMFAGQAEEAMRLYVSLFPNSEAVSIERCGPGEAGAEGSVKLRYDFSSRFAWTQDKYGVSWQLSLS